MSQEGSLRRSRRREKEIETEGAALLEQEVAGAGGTVHFTGKVWGAGLRLDSTSLQHAQPSLVPGAPASADL